MKSSGLLPVPFTYLLTSLPSLPHYFVTSSPSHYSPLSCYLPVPHYFSLTPLLSPVLSPPHYFLPAPLLSLNLIIVPHGFDPTLPITFPPRPSHTHPITSPPTTPLFPCCPSTFPPTAPPPPHHSTTPITSPLPPNPLQLPRPHTPLHLHLTLLPCPILPHLLHYFLPCSPLPIPFHAPLPHYFHLITPHYPHPSYSSPHPSLALPTAIILLPPCPFDSTRPITLSHYPFPVLVLLLTPHPITSSYAVTSSLPSPFPHGFPTRHSQCRGGSRIGETGVRKREALPLGGSGGVPRQENFGALILFLLHSKVKNNKN